MLVVYALSGVNLLLGVSLVWRRPLDGVARLVGLEMVGAAAYLHALLVFRNGTVVPARLVWLVRVAYLIFLAIVSDSLFDVDPSIPGRRTQWRNGWPATGALQSQGSEPAVRPEPGRPIGPLAEGNQHYGHMLRKRQCISRRLN